MKRRRRRVLMACSRAAGSTLPASTLDYVARYTPEGVYADAGGTTRPANGGTVALWRDAGPVGYDLTVTGAAPTWDSTAGYLGQTNGGTFPNLNPFGVPTATGGVKFNGSTQGLANAAFNAVPNTTSPITVAVVCRALVGGSAGPAVGLGSNGAYMSYLPSRAGGDEWNTYKPSGGGGIYNPNRPDTGRVFVFVFDPAGGTFAAKGKLWEFGAAQVVSGASYPNPGAISAGLRFGSDTVFPHFFSGYLWEVIIWNRALTATEQAAVGNYLADKYVRTGYRHLYCGGDSLTRGYPSSQDDNPATSGGGDDSYPHQLWSLLEARGPGHWSFRNDGQTAYTVGTGIAGSPGSVQNATSLWPSYRDMWSSEVAILEGGTNDITRGQTDAQVIASIQAMCSPVAAAGFGKVILWTIPRRGDWPLGSGPYGGISGGTWSDAFEAIRLAVNDWIRNSAVSGGYCTHVYDPEAEGFTNPADGVLYTADMLHFTNAGYALHASNLLARIT